MAAEDKKQNINRVTGKVTDSNGLPLGGLKVEIHDVDMREWQLLADTVTDRRGVYNLHWSHDQLSGREKGTADIAVKVLSPGKNIELFKSTDRRSKVQCRKS
jgi:5-hydroxyisourate hydrolase-like protein (transthyretin family)